MSYASFWAQSMFECAKAAELLDSKRMYYAGSKMREEQRELAAIIISMGC